MTKGQEYKRNSDITGVDYMLTDALDWSITDRWILSFNYMPIKSGVQAGRPWFDPGRREGRDISSLFCLEIGPGTHSTFYKMNTGSFPWLEKAELS